MAQYKYIKMLKDQNTNSKKTTDLVKNKFENLKNSGVRRMKSNPTILKELYDGILEQKEECDLSD